MGFLSGIPIVGGLLDGLTGQSQADAINRQTRSSTRLQQQHLDMLKEVFGNAMNAVANARAEGVFDPSKIRVNVQRNVDNALAGLAARGLIAGAKAGDTVQSENIARGAIEGGRALENVDFEALTRELQALNAVLPSASGAGQAVSAMNQTGMQGLQLKLANQQATNQNLGNLAMLGSMFFNSKNKPQFGTSGSAPGLGFRPGSFGA